MENINYLAVLVSGVLSMVIGFVWYGPLFGKIWMAESKWSEQEMAEAKGKGMAKSYFLSFIGNLVMIYVLAVFMNAKGAPDLTQATGVAFWLWLGFVATVQLSNELFSKTKSMKLFLVNAGQNLAVMVVASIVLTLWK